MNLFGKSAVVYGGGASGLSACRLLADMGAKAIIYDDNPDCKNATHSVGVFSNADIIVLSPGVDGGKDFLLDARLENKLVISELELAYRLCRAEQIAITGTNGKTDTTLLIDHVLKRAGLHSHCAGNVGIPFSAIADKLDATEIAVIEASSYQLEACVDFSPDIAVILNVTPDHLSRHKTMNNYVDAKAKIFRKQSECDYVIYNADDERICALTPQMLAHKIPFSAKRIVLDGAYLSSGFVCFKGCPIVSLDDLDFKGEELQDVLATVAVCMTKGVSAFCTASAITDFSKPKYRRELVAIKDGIHIYNDSKATNVSACLCACDCVGDCVLILGGQRGTEDFDELFSRLSSHVRFVVITGENSSDISSSAYKFGYTNTAVCDTLSTALSVAVAKARELNCDSVLFSPASKSFDMYKSFEERGKRFDEAVALLPSGR